MSKYNCAVTYFRKYITAIDIPWCEGIEILAFGSFANSIEIHEDVSRKIRSGTVHCNLPPIC